MYDSRAYVEYNIIEVVGKYINSLNFERITTEVSRIPGLFIC